MKLSHLFCLGAALVTLSGIARAGAIDELSDPQKTAVENGQQVYLDQKIDGKPWPKMFLYQRIDCTPEEAAAVTMDWDLRPAYTSDLKSAQVSDQVNATTAEVDYLLAVPFLGDEPFTLSNQISAYGPGEAYRNDWHLVRAKRTKESTGNARFEVLGTGTLMAVTSFIDPGSSFAGIVTGKAIQQFKDSATGFVKQVETERTTNQTLLQKQLAAIRVALGH